MAAPKFARVPQSEGVRAYESPEYVPEAWTPDRPAEIEGRQPEGMRLGYQGPDQGYAFTLAERFRGRMHAGEGVSVDDAMLGSLNIALRRASLFGRAPVVHDISVACAIWGWLDESPPADLAARRRELFAGVADTLNYYGKGRMIADLVPEYTLRLSPEAASEAYAAGRWLELTGA